MSEGKAAATVVPASSVDTALATRIAALLGRAFTDEARVADYTESERLRWADDIRRVRAADAGHAILMPRDWLERFPSVRNLDLAADRRMPAWHLVRDGEGYLAGHVAIFERSFKLGQHRRFQAGFIEDVATEPSDAGQGLATLLMREAAGVGASRGYPLLALSTRIPGFYERLGWGRWTGDVTLIGREDTRTIDRAMTLALTAGGTRMLTSARGKSFSVREPGTPP